MAEDARIDYVGFLATDHEVSKAGTVGYPYQLASSDPPSIDRRCMEKELRVNGRRGTLLHLVATEVSKDTQKWDRMPLEEDKSYFTWAKTHHPRLAKILGLYIQIFQKPSGVPPDWAHSTKITLKPVNGPIPIIPYRYLYYRKKEIEKSVAKMLERGIIRPSTSAYSSPVLLAKKNDGSWQFWWTPEL